MPMQHYDWTAHHAHLRPNDVAMVELERQWELTYAELDNRASRLASWMQAHGIGAGDRAAILLKNCPEYLELQFACFKIGAIFVPLNWRLTENELEYIINDCSPSLLVHGAELAETSRSLQARCNLAKLLEVDFESRENAYENALSAASETYLPVAQTLEDVSTIMYTSGTTGHPKGAMITHGMTFINCVNLGIPTGISPHAVQLVVLPLFHTGGLNCYANPVLHAGGRIVLMREFEPGAALRAIGDEKFGITHFFAVPAPYQFMMLHPEFGNTDLSRLEIAGVGGAPCAEAILKTWQARGVDVIQGWGMTETSPGGIALPAGDAVRKLGSAGKPLLHTQIRIIDDEGRDLPRGETGELLIRGPNVTPGYWNNPDATARSFIDDWLKTGDAARMDEEGFVYIVDRWKDMYISGGENVYPAEVENVLYQLPQIAEAAVIGVPSDKWGETGMAVLVVKAGETLDEATVFSHCVANLAKFKCPQSVAFTEALPRNATGKVLKRTLREQFVGADAPAIS